MSDITFVFVIIKLKTRVIFVDCIIGQMNIVHLQILSLRFLILDGCETYKSYTNKPYLLYTYIFEEDQPQLITHKF